MGVGGLKGDVGLPAQVRPLLIILVGSWLELTCRQHGHNNEYRWRLEPVMFQFMAIKVARILEAIFDEIEYRMAKRSIRHTGPNRKGLLSKY